MKNILVTIFFSWNVLLFGQIDTTKGHCKTQFDSIWNRILYLTVDTVPEFPGGIDAMFKFVYSNIVWPNDGADYMGIVYVSLIIEPDGSITNKSILRGIHKVIDEEVLRVIDKMPKWKPGKCKGENVPVKYVIPIKFKLNYK